MWMLPPDDIDESINWVLVDVLARVTLPSCITRQYSINADRCAADAVSGHNCSQC